MTEFGAAATLEITEINGAQSAIEQEVSVPMEASPAPSQRQRSSAGVGGAGGGASLPSLAKERNETLGEILDTLEQMGGGGLGGGPVDFSKAASSGGGGLLGGALGGIGGGAAASAGGTAATFGGAALGGLGGGLAGAAGLARIGTFGTIRQAGRDTRSLVGGENTDRALSAANVASGGGFGAGIQAGGAIVDLARGDGINGPMSRQADRQFRDTGEIVGDARGGTIEEPDWLSDGSVWPTPPDPFAGVTWPDPPSVSSQIEWPDVPQPGQGWSWPAIPTPSQADLPTLPVPDASDLPKLEVILPDALKNAGGSVSTTTDSAINTGTSVLDADGDGDLDTDDVGRAFRDTFGGG